LDAECLLIATKTNKKLDTLKVGRVYSHHL
jgi:hypothetical protein